MGFVVGAAQIAPVWMDRSATIEKVVQYVREAADAGCRLVAFGETLVPGYPFWVQRMNPSAFEMYQDTHALYLDQSVSIEDGHLDEICRVARERSISVILGVAERPGDRGGHSVYCSAVTIDAGGHVVSVHRKLLPTYWERMTWAAGDGHGLVTHRMDEFTVGSLNCWENWMPLSRAALYAQGEDLHVALWPGTIGDTARITPFIAFENRSYVVSVSSVLNRNDVPGFLPSAEIMRAYPDEFIADGGTCIAAPDGSWLVEPVGEKEQLIVVELDHSKVRAERQHFDPAGHYSRPDVTRLLVDRRRQALVTFTE